MDQDLTGLGDDTRWYYQMIKQEVLERMKEKKSKASGANTDASPLLARGKGDSGAASEKEIN